MTTDTDQISPGSELDNGVSTPTKRKTFTVAVYDCEQRFGGPEEGGWWYDGGSLVRIVKTFPNENWAYNYCHRLNHRLGSRTFGPNTGKHGYTSVLSEGELQARVFEEDIPKYFPEEQPHYE